MLPAPSSLSTQMRPPWPSTIVRQIARPRPVPPLSRESDASTCWKRPKIESSLSAGMPRPWSITSKRVPPATAEQPTRTVPPSLENLSALEMRFVSAWRMRSGSAETLARPSPTSSVTPASAASCSSPSTARTRRSLAAQVSRAIGTCPEVMRSMSRMSLMSRTRRSVFCTAISTMRRPFSGSSPSTPDSNSPSEPRIDVSGVRSSWLTTEVNSSFARSAARDAVMSCAVPSFATSTPFSSRTTSHRACSTRSPPSSWRMRCSNENESPPL